MTSTLIHISLVLSLAGNLIFLWCWSNDSSRSDSQRTIVLGELPSVLPARRTRGKPRDVKHNKPAPVRFMLPWEWAQDAQWAVFTEDEFALDDDLLTALQLTDEEVAAMKRAVERLEASWRAMEVAGLVDSGSEKEVTFVPDDAERKRIVEAFLSELRTSLRPTTMRRMEHLVGQDKFLARPAEVTLTFSKNPRSGPSVWIQTQVYDLDNGPPRKTWVERRQRPLSPSIKQRWGHLVDFNALETAWGISDEAPQ